MKKSSSSSWKWVLPMLLLIFNQATSNSQSTTTKPSKTSEKEIVISIAGIEYDDPGFSNLKESIRKNSKVKSLKPSYTNGTAKISLLFSGEATELWDQLPATVKQSYKLSAIDEQRIILEAKKNSKQTELVTTTSSNAKTNTSSVASASFKNMWVDYDVTENALYGMKIHVHFETFNMKDLDSYLAIYFSKKNGDKLFTNNTAYRSTTGQLAIFKSLKPAYNEAVFKDLQLFLPYNELNLGQGSFDLKMDVYVIYPNGTAVNYLTAKEFRFSQ